LQQLCRKADTLQVQAGVAGRLGSKAWASGKARQLWLVMMLLLLAAAGSASVAGAQSCTTLTASAPQRAVVIAAALSIAQAVQTADLSRVGALSAPAIAQNFAPTAAVVGRISSHFAGATLRATFAYLLDASAATAHPGSTIDFICTTASSTAEVDFSIPGLQAGRYAFVIVEADSAGPEDAWELPLLLSEQAGAWKLAGLYPHAKTAAGHDGLWYWREARTRLAAKQPWAAWLDFDLARQLLSPAPFVDSSNLDKLQAEAAAGAPPELAEAPNDARPLGLKLSSGAEVNVTHLGAQRSDDGRRVEIVLHYTPSAANSSSESAVSDVPAVQTRERNLAVVKALLTAHPELRQGFASVLVVASIGGSEPVVSNVPTGMAP
jgi:hypothetical protein